MIMISWAGQRARSGKRRQAPIAPIEGKKVKQVQPIGVQLLLDYDYGCESSLPKRRSWMVNSGLIAVIDLQSKSAKQNSNDIAD
jgi:hypothetical protein